MLKFIKTTLISIVAIVVLLTVLAIDISPDIRMSSAQQVDKADSVNQLLKQLRSVALDRENPHRIKVKQEQAHSLAGFVQRAKNEAHADVQFEQDIAHFKLSYHLGHFITDFYLNVEVSLHSASGIDIGALRVGSVYIPGALALLLAEYSANQYTQSQAATMALEWVENVIITEQAMVLDLSPSLDLFTELKQINTGSDDEASLVLRTQVAHYVSVLHTLKKPDHVPSLSFYLASVMTEALRLSEHSDASLENKAAILAVAIYAGNYRFARLVGDIGIPISEMPTAPKIPTLHGRADLNLHFVFSAAIKLLSEQGFSIAVGEFKELMDRGPNGSGYSFTDLAADMAGAHFAALAVDPEFATSIQLALAKSAEESVFMPSIVGLDEGLDARAFTSKYQAVDSPMYQQTVDLIAQRIQALPVSRKRQGE